MDTGYRKPDWVALYHCVIEIRTVNTLVIERSGATPTNQNAEVKRADVVQDGLLTPELPTRS